MSEENDLYDIDAIVEAQSMVLESHEKTIHKLEARIKFLEEWVARQ